MKSALNISFKMFTGSIQVLIHAFIPCLFTSNGSDKCREIIIFVDSKKK